MSKNHLAIRLKELRHRKGMSQEMLADESGLSLRTIQRIENGQTNPTGESLKRLSSALHVNPDELIDWTIKDDEKYLIYLNLSALTFLCFPILGILIPFMLWTSKKDKIKGVNVLGKALINFQITWVITLCVMPLLMFLFAKFELIEKLSISTIFSIVGILYLINLIFILINTLRISNKKTVIYYPQIKFLR